MKKILMLIIVLVLPLIVFAKDFEIKDIDLKIKLKDDYIVFTRDNISNNEDLSKLNIKEDYMKEVMDNNNIYLDILNNDVSYEILVVVPNKTLSFYDLSSATDSMLDDLKNELMKKTGSEKASIYKKNHNYIVVDYYDKNTDNYIVNYYTVVNAKGYNFQLQKKNEITDTEKQELKEIIDSVNITVKESDNKNTGFSIKNIIIGAIIGAIVGLISYIISNYLKKNNNDNKKVKKSSNKKKKLEIEDNIK